MAVMKSLVIARMRGRWVVLAPHRQGGFNTLEEAMTFAYETADWEGAHDGAVNAGNEAVHSC